MTGVLILGFITTALIRCAHLVLLKKYDGDMKFSEECLLLVMTVLMITCLMAVNLGFILLIWILLIGICVFTLLYSD